MNRNTAAASLPSSVQAMQDIPISGNIVPMHWFKTIIFSNGKPDTNSILILSDIVYWYRPTEIRDERTGSILGYKKKFSEDLLRRSYSDLEDQFGLSKKQCQECLRRLEEKGVISRIFRTLETTQGRQNNVMYIELHPNKLNEITHPKLIKSFQESQSQSFQGVTDIDTPYGDQTPQVWNSNSIDVETKLHSYGDQTPHHIKDTNTTSHTSSNNSLSSKSCLDSESIDAESEVLERESLKNKKEKSISERMLDIWNQTVKSKSLPSLNSYLARDMDLAFTEQLDSDLSNWQTVCDHFISSKFLMGEAEGVRINPDLSWLTSSKEPRVSRVLQKQHYTFGDRLSAQQKGPDMSGLLSQIDLSSEHPITKAVRRQILKSDPGFYVSYILKSEIKKDGDSMFIKAITGFARDKISEKFLSPMNSFLEREYEMTLKII